MRKNRLRNSEGGKGRKKTSCAGAVFTMVGGVIGAGFVSGRELLQFFGGFNISAVYIAGFCFFFSFLLFVRLGRKYGGFDGAVNAVFRRGAKFVKAAILFGSFASSVGMLSGLNALFPGIKPMFSAVILAATCLISEKGMKGIGIVNMLTMPVLLSSVTALVAGRGAMSASDALAPASGFSAFASAVLYVEMNTFLSMPVLCDLGAEIEGKGEAACALSSGIIAAAIGFILSAVCFDKSSFSFDLPLAHVLGDVKWFPFIVCGGMVTTLITSFYPLYVLAGAKGGKQSVVLKCVLAIGAEICSFIGFKSIVANVYPALAVCGVIITGYAAVVYFKREYFCRRLNPACHLSYR